MSERKEKKIRRLQRRIEELEGEVDMLRSLGYGKVMDAHYVPVPSGRKLGIWQWLKAWLFG